MSGVSDFADQDSSTLQKWTTCQIQSGAVRDIKCLSHIKEPDVLICVIEGYGVIDWLILCSLWQLYYELKRSLVVYTMLVWTSGSPCKVSLWRDYILLPYLKYSSRILAQIRYQEAAVLGLERMQLLIIRTWMTIKPSFPLHTLKREDYKCCTHQCFFLLPHECILLFFQRQSKCSCIPRDEVARIQYSSISLVWWITITLKYCDDVSSFQFILLKKKEY
jgi:hypothetical protein